jgi:hypothetical protein
MSNSITHAGLAFPVKGARFTLLVPYLDADGDPTDPTTPDTEISKDGGAFADCAEEVTTISGSNGVGYLTLTGDELNASVVALCAKVASGPKATLLTLHPRVLPVVRAGTAQAGAAGSITLDSGAASIDDYYNGCLVRTTGGTGGGGGAGALNNQARVVTDYNGSTKVATVVPNWDTSPDNTTTFELLQTENSLGLLAPAASYTPARAAKLDDIDVAVSSRLPTASYTAPDNTTIGLVYSAVDGEVAAIKSQTDKLQFDGSNNVRSTPQTAVTVGDKTGFQLAADGLDAISTAAPAGAASDFREMLVQLWRRFFRKSTLTSTELKTYADDGTTVVTTQTVSDDGTTQVQGGA